jgi:DNA-binding CsgD family transcriptional regulator
MRGGYGQSLTPREFEVLEGMASGLSNADIGEKLFISENTVKTHTRQLFRKLGARERTHAVALGYQLGLLVGTGSRREADRARASAARAWLDEWRPTRAAAPDHSRFARFYDGLAERLAARPPS